MNNGKVRIYELSRELNLDNVDLLAVCEQLNISVKSHSSTITDTEAEMIRAAVEKYIASRPSPAKAVPSRNGTNVHQAAEVKARTAVPVQKKQQILEIRKPTIRQHPSPVAEQPLSVEVKTRTAVPVQKKQQILEIRKPTIRQRPSPVAEQPLSVRRGSRTGQGYIEPLLNVGTAIPLHMVLIPSGSFTMGSPENELKRNDNESPQHEVTVSPFFMGRYPVTQAQWRAVAGLPQVKQTLNPEPSYFKGKDNHPVEQVSWDDAVEFCARLEQHTKRPYRLPTEAEWEYACRAGTTTPFYFGKTLTDELANYGASEPYANGPTGEYRQETTPVDYFGIANAFGLADMHGNVLEWCQDYWHDNYEGAPTDGSAWLTNKKVDWRVLRGGSWSFDPRNCRSAYRRYYDPVNRDFNLGFRVCCSGPRTL